MHATLAILEKNIRGYLDQAHAHELENGAAWYENANAFCQELAHEFSTTVEVAAHVVAALSPFVGWANNKQSAYNVFRAVQDGIPLLESTGIAGFTRNRERAYAIAQTGDLGLLSGDKVTHFAANIIDPYSDHVTVDRWAWRIAVSDDLDWPTMTTKRRLLVENAYRKVAASAGLPPPALQAITWVVVRRVSNLHAVYG